MAGADGLRLRARLEESYETNNIPVMRNFLCTSQLDLDDEDSCDRFHNTTTHDSLALAVFSGMNVDNCPHSTPAVLPLTKVRHRPLDLMINDDTTALAEMSTSPEMSTIGANSSVRSTNASI